MKHNYLKFFLVMFCLCLFANVAYGDGMIFPIHEERIIFVPPSQPEQNFTVPLSVNKHHVKIRINNLAATTEVDQTFFNHENRTVEGLYIFPLPVNASISGFSMDVEGKMTSGELMDADKARKIYEDIVRQMRDPGLLEYMGQGVFKTRIYPIEGRSEKNVKIAYQEALKMEGGLVRYVYPLDIDKYTKEDMKDVSIEALIRSDLPISSVYSPTHKISIHRKNEREIVVGFEAEKHFPEKDFVIYYAVASKDLSLTAINHRPDPSEDGTFMLMLAPALKAQQEKTPSIDVALVMDTSGSMAGKKIVQARKALEYCINSLSDDNNFILIGFSTEAEAYKSGLTAMTADTRAGALNYIKNLDAAGGTNISEALEMAVKELNKSQSKNPRFIVFVTDGKPTAGTTDPEEISKLVSRKNTEGIRLFSFGVGDDLNANLIDNLATENSGVSDYVSEDEDLEIKISSLFSKLTHPVMTDVSLQFHNVEVTQIYPRKVGDIFKGSNVLILGRYSKPGAARITLSGRLRNEMVKLDFETDFPAREGENAFVAKIWATRKIGFLLEQIRKNGSDDELKNEIITLAKRYGILTPYTSYLVLEDNDKFGPNLRQTMIRDNMPSASFDEEKSRFSLQRLESLSDGADAVGASREMNSLKAAAAPQSFAPAASVYRKKGSTSSIQTPISKEAGGKTFYFIDEKWIDSAIKGQKPDITIKAWSAAYFDLCNKYPDLAKMLSIGDKIIVIYKDKVVEISPERGEEKIINL